MAEQTNSSTMRFKNVGKQSTAISGRTPRSKLSRWEDLRSSARRKGITRKQPSSIPRWSNPTIVHSDRKYEAAFTTPTKECRDENSSERHAVSTPAADATSEEKWTGWFVSINHSPLKAIENKDFDESMEMANKLLDLSGDFKNKTIDDLENCQKAVLAYQVLTEMYNALDGVVELRDAAQRLKETWHTEEKAHKRMHGLVRKHGDIVHNGYTGLAPSIAASFLEVVAILYQQEDAINLLNAKDIEPIYYMQNEFSYVCAFVAGVTLLFYSADREYFKDRRVQILINLSKFMREKVEPSMAADLAGLTERKGAPLEDVLLLLAKCFGATGCGKIKTMELHIDCETSNFKLLSQVLSRGHAIAFTIEVFPDLAKKSSRRNQYFKDISGYYSDVNPRPHKKKRQYHALLIIGIRYMRGVGAVLLIQDSCKTQPIFEVSLKLLMSMGIEDLDFFTVCKNWKFREDGKYRMTPQSRAQVVGSPRRFATDSCDDVVPQTGEPRPDKDYWHLPAEGPCWYEVV